MFQNVAFQWFARRALEIGGIVGLLFQIYANLPEYAQRAIAEVVTGDASPQAKATAIGAVAVALWGYIWSYRSTTQAQVVTSDGVKQTPKPNSSAMADIEAIAADAPRNKTLFEKLFKL